MVTIKQALTNTHGASIRRTIADIEVGEAFKWVVIRGRAIGWCMRLSNEVAKPELNLPYAWTPVEGEAVGMVFGDEGKAEIHQP